MVEKSLVKNDVSSLLNNKSNPTSATSINGTINTSTSGNNNNKPRQIMDEDDLKARKTRNRRRRPPKSEKKATADNNAMHFNHEHQTYNQVIIVY